MKVIKKCTGYFKMGRVFNEGNKKCIGYLRSAGYLVMVIKKCTSCSRPTGHSISRNEWTSYPK